MGIRRSEARSLRMGYMMAFRRCEEEVVVEVGVAAGGIKCIEEEAEEVE